MTKKIILAIVGLLVLVGVIGGAKVLQIRKMIDHARQFTPPPETVTTVLVKSDSWERLLTSVGSLVAVQGVGVTAELEGKVVKIAFEPGSAVKAGSALVQQDTSTEEAELRAAEAALVLAEANFQRAKELFARKVMSRSEYDNAAAQYEQGRAQADNIRTIIAKKTIRAPFSGRLGIRLVNLGQNLKGGDPIVSLQTLDPIFVNFLLPQQQCTELKVGLTVRVATDALPGAVIEGKITAINPQVDAATRNIEVQATLANPDERLRPGMYVRVAVLLPKADQVLAVPATAILYAPYSDSVFVLEEVDQSKGAGSGKVVRQQFVRLGRKRGDYVAVLSGLKGGEQIVSTGVFKLRNGQAVVIDNTLSPVFKLQPNPEDA